MNTKLKLDLQSKNFKLISMGITAVVIGTAVALTISSLGRIAPPKFIKNNRPKNMVWTVAEPDGFIETEGRTNNAFNVADFGPQSSNGWMYKAGDATEPWLATTLRYNENTEKYEDISARGLEIKKDFVHTSEDKDVVLHWRVAKAGKININTTYVLGVNADKNPSWPDGVSVKVYHNKDMIHTDDVEIFIDKQNIVEFSATDIDVEEGDSFYFVVDAKRNSAFDGGTYYVSITDENNAYVASVPHSQTDNNANNIADFGTQGNNGWVYQTGKTLEDMRNVSTYSDFKYLDNTTPNLEIAKDYIHPGVNRYAALSWTAHSNSNVNINLKYEKFAQDDGNKDWPDGVNLSFLKNGEVINEKYIEVFNGKSNTYDFNLDNYKINKNDVLTVIIDSNTNSAWDGGRVELDIKDLSTIKNELNTVIPNDAQRTNNASVSKDFGAQGLNGWFYQTNSSKQPLGAENISKYLENDKYFDDHGLEIKSSFIQPSADKSALVKWVVALDGEVKITSNYTKFVDNDANPHWADGTLVSLYHNNTLLKQERFFANRTEEVYKDLSVDYLKVKKKDTITLVVDGLSNNAYDGGLYSLSIKDLSNQKDATKYTENTNSSNTTSFENSFGEQGSDGWYYLYGSTIANAKFTEEYAEEKHYSEKAPNLEIKKDFIHPAANASAIIQWVVAKDGNIDVLGSYTKFGHDDGNVNWPDGTRLIVHLNNKEIMNKKVNVSHLEENVIPIALKKIKVLKNDKLSFQIIAESNIAYDGGVLDIVIKEEQEVITIPPYSNTTTLSKDFGVQGINGWYYGYGTDANNFKQAEGFDEENGVHFQPGLPGLALKHDFVEPNEKEAVIYVWKVSESGKINLTSDYTKYKNGNPEDIYPNGVIFKVYHNDKLLVTEDIKVSTSDDIKFTYDLQDIDVKKDDKFYFVIDAKNNNAWDGGKLEVSIEDTIELPEPENNRKNKADYCTDFGEQANNGWYYGYGKDARSFKLLPNFDNDTYYSESINNLEIKEDYLHPNDENGAIIQWVVSETGAIDIKGNYIKFRNGDANVEWPDSTQLTIFQNNKVILEKEMNMSSTKDLENEIIILNLKVNANDKISFLISANSNLAWDGGTLNVSIDVADGTTNPPVTRPNAANLYNDFGAQGSNGWNFGFGMKPNEFQRALNYNKKEGKYTLWGFGKPELKKDFFEPSVDHAIQYKWTANQSSPIDMDLKLIKFGHDDGNPSWPDGVRLDIYHNLTLLHSEKVPVSKNEDYIFDYKLQNYNITSEDELSFIISANSNDAWDGGKLEVNINESK